MNRFIKNHVSQILGVVLSVFSLIYIYLYQLLVETLCGANLNLFLFMAGGLFIISGLIFFACHCGPLMVITCKEKICTLKQPAKVLNHTDKGTKIQIDDTVYILPCKLSKRKYPVDSELEVYTDKDLTTIYYQIKGESVRHIIGMIISIVFIFVCIVGLAYLIKTLGLLG